MCGISLVAQRYGARDEALHHSLKKTVQARGTCRAARLLTQGRMMQAT